MLPQINEVTDHLEKETKQPYNTCTTLVTCFRESTKQRPKSFWFLCVSLKIGSFDLAFIRDRRSIGVRRLIEELRNIFTLYTEFA